MSYKSDSPSELKPRTKAKKEDKLKDELLEKDNTYEVEENDEDIINAKAKWEASESGRDSEEYEAYINSRNVIGTYNTLVTVVDFEKFYKRIVIKNRKPLHHGKGFRK